MSLRRTGRLLMRLGATVGAFDVCAIALHLAPAGVPWLVNVALVKLSCVAAGGWLPARDRCVSRAAANGTSSTRRRVPASAASGRSNLRVSDEEATARNRHKSREELLVDVNV